MTDRIKLPDGVELSRRLPTAARRRVVALNPEMSTRALAGALGVAHTTIQTDRLHAEASAMTEHSYADAIAHLTEALGVLNRPGEGLGVAWGLQRGQAGWFYLVRARDGIQQLRDELVKHERIAEAGR